MILDDILRNFLHRYTGRLIRLFNIKIVKEKATSALVYPSFLYFECYIKGFLSLIRHAWQHLNK